MVHFNYSHLTRSKKLEDFIESSLATIITNDVPVSSVYCFLSRAFDHRDRLKSTLKMQVRLESSDSFVLEKSAGNFKSAYKQMAEELQYMFKKSDPDQALASA
ncbi:hypothetical protein [Nonlabens ponticola]|uniref:HPF/RaiA family ribosome-associated protein n=1 Tax=Nonlabens ponticola TaxID=2496866 RepID=A0A3S9MYN2_9FLAO|nr:hypothetical protein [Nonlabens ponticola]AZQ44361.1 hypothetical protein EJ995_08960 [Nonlabens ponticola]